MASIRVNMEQHIVLEGLPSNVGPAQKEKFRTVLESTVSKVVGHSSYVLRLIDGPDGFVAAAFIDFKTVTAADAAVARLHKYTFTKTSTLMAYRWSDFDAFLRTGDNYEPPSEASSASAAAGETLDMTNTLMMDARARPQLFIKGGDGYEVNFYWFNTNRNALDLIKGPSRDDAARTWSEMDRRAKKLQTGIPSPMPMWSPLGTYLLTQHPNGIRFWGGRVMSEVALIPLTEVTKIYISPCEKYFVSFASDICQFWHIAESRLIREIKQEAPDWPSFKYNANDTLAGVIAKSVRRGASSINIYHAATMRRLLNAAEPEEKHTISIDGLCAFEWSPMNPDVFAYVVSGDESQGFRVHIERIDYDGEGDVLSLTTMLRRNVYQAMSIDLMWHPEGSLMATKVTTTRETSEYIICRVGASTASAEKLELKNIDGKPTEPVRFSFQPNANRFAVIQREKGSDIENLKKWVVFYSAEKVGFKEICSHKTEGHRLHWAPKGARCVISNFERSKIEFFGVSGFFTTATPNPPFTLLAAEQHPMVTSVAWDPTGRYFVTYTSSLEQQMDNAYRIWNVNGVAVASDKIPKLSHIAWRPLAKTVLTAEQLQRLRRDLPATSQRYVEEALAEQRKLEAAATKKKADAEEKYKKRMSAIKAYAEEVDWAGQRAEQMASSAAWKAQQKLLKEMPPIPVAAAAAAAST